jgi:hypothetical protein
MFRMTLHSILLLAVAYSQILGGVSCCCLGKSLFASINQRLQVYDSGVFSSGAGVTERARCPKCASPSSTGSAEKQSRPGSRSLLQTDLSACQDGQCNCSKLVLNASEPREPVSVPRTSIGWETPSVTFPGSSTLVLSNLGRFEVPLRFGGRSWQSIACVWKN